MCGGTFTLRRTSTRASRRASIVGQGGILPPEVIVHSEVSIQGISGETNHA